MERMPKVIKVDERIIQLEKQREQLTARVKWCNDEMVRLDKHIANAHLECRDMKQRIATLEQQYAKLRDEYNGLVFVNNELEQQLKDSEELNAENSRRCINNANEILRQGKISGDYQFKCIELEQQLKDAKCWVDAFVRLQKHCYGDAMNTHIGLSNLVREYEQAIAERDGGEKI